LTQFEQNRAPLRPEVARDGEALYKTAPLSVAVVLLEGPPALSAGSRSFSLESETRYPPKEYQLTRHGRGRSVVAGSADALGARRAGGPRVRAMSTKCEFGADLVEHGQEAARVRGEADDPCPTRN